MIDTCKAIKCSNPFTCLSVFVYFSVQPYCPDWLTRFLSLDINGKFCPGSIRDIYICLGWIPIGIDFGVPLFPGDKVSRLLCVRIRIDNKQMVFRLFIAYCYVVTYMISMDRPDGRYKDSFPLRVRFDHYISLAKWGSVFVSDLPHIVGSALNSIKCNGCRILRNAVLYSNFFSPDLPVLLYIVTFTLLFKCKVNVKVDILHISRSDYLYLFFDGDSFASLRPYVIGSFCPDGCCSRIVCNCCCYSVFRSKGALSAIDCPLFDHIAVGGYTSYCYCRSQ